MLRQLGCAILSAFAGTLFYKKSFKQHEIPLVLHAIILAATCRFCDATTLTIVGLASAFIMMDRQRQVMTIDVIKTTKLSMFLTLLALAFDMEWNLGMQVLQVHPRTWIKVRIFGAAFVQFVRRPSSVKVMLQEVRSHLGPVFVISLFQLGLRSTSASPVKAVFLLTAAAAALAAGTFFRPDNTGLSSLICDSTSSWRKTYHRALMTTACAIYMFDIANDVLNLVMPPSAAGMATLLQPCHLNETCVQYE